MPQVVDCSIFESRTTVNNRILLQWNDPDRIGMFAPYYWSVPFWWIGLVVLAVIAVIVVIARWRYFAIERREARKRSKAVMRRLYGDEYTRSDVHQALKPYFGDNDDFLIFTILDYAGITLGTEADLARKNDSRVTAAARVHESNNQSLAFWSCLGIIAGFALCYFFVIHAAMVFAVEYGDNWTQIEVDELDLDDQYLVLDFMFWPYTMEDWCVDGTMNTSHDYEFVFARKGYSAGPSWKDFKWRARMRPADITIAIHRSAASEIVVVVIGFFTIFGLIGTWIRVAVDVQCLCSENRDRKTSYIGLQQDE